MFKLQHVHNDIVATKCRWLARLQRMWLVQETTQGKLLSLSLEFSCLAGLRSKQNEELIKSNSPKITRHTRVLINSKNVMIHLVFNSNLSFHAKVGFKTVENANKKTNLSYFNL
jgi:hypothetical protein